MGTSHLFARLYLDENVDVRVANIIAGRGFEVTSARDQGMLEKEDSEQLAFAAEQGMAIVTHDREDFEDLARQYFTEGRPHAGIIIAVDRPFAAVTRRLLAVLNDRTANELDNQVIYI